MSRIPPHTARLVSTWPQARSRPQSRRDRIRAAGHALTGGVVVVARALHLLRSPARPRVAGHLGRHA